jgi:hypothetical protein
MYRKQLENLKINEVMNVFANVQVWRNNASKLHKESGKVFHIKNLKDHTMIIRLF